MYKPGESPSYNVHSILSTRVLMNLAAEQKGDDDVMLKTGGRPAAASTASRLDPIVTWLT